MTDFFLIYDNRDKLVGSLRPESTWMLGFLLRCYSEGTAVESITVTDRKKESRENIPGKLLQKES